MNGTSSESLPPITENNINKKIKMIGNIRIFFLSEANFINEIKKFI